jgi:hypothetical protein
MQTRDGVRLDADVYAPDQAGEFPVLLMRQPYGRAIASTVVYTHPAWYAAQGYLVVIQDVRGRGTSEGEFFLFAHEVADGADAVQWAAALPQSSGRVGMYGFSYQGMTQLYAAMARPSALQTICPSMVGYDLYQDWAYEGGAFCHQLNLGWAIQLAAETARRKGDEVAYQELYAAARHVPLSNPVEVQSSLLQRLAPDSFYHDWVNHPKPDAYWESLSPQMQAVDLPMLHIGGWFDTYLRGTLRLYQEMARRSQYRQSLWVGPWAHLPWGRRVGGVDYGTAAISPIDRLQIRWFDHFLKDMDTGLLEEPPVNLFEMGTNVWRSLPHYPPPPSKTYFLVTTGLAAMDEQAGTLVETLHPAPTFPDPWVHDPWRPVPAVGGHAAIAAGMGDRTTIDSRSDVVTYTTAPLANPMHLMGEIQVELHCTADVPSFDLCAVLSEVKPDGTVLSFSQGYRRVEQDSSGIFDEISAIVSIALQPTCICLVSGHALRLSISAACAPAYAVNPGTGDTIKTAKLIEAKVITLALHSPPDQPSKLVLPVPPST